MSESPPTHSTSPRHSRFSDQSKSPPSDPTYPARLGSEGTSTASPSHPTPSTSISPPLDQSQANTTSLPFQSLADLDLVQLPGLHSVSDANADQPNPTANDTAGQSPTRQHHGRSFIASQQARRALKRDQLLADFDEDDLFDDPREGSKLEEIKPTHSTPSSSSPSSSISYSGAPDLTEFWHRYHDAKNGVPFLPYVSQIEFPKDFSTFRPEKQSIAFVNNFFVNLFDEELAFEDIYTVEPIPVGLQNYEVCLICHVGLPKDSSHNTSAKANHVLSHIRYYSQFPPFTTSTMTQLRTIASTGTFSNCDVCRTAYSTFGELTVHKRTVNHQKIHHLVTSNASPLMLELFTSSLRPDLFAKLPAEYFRAKKLNPITIVDDFDHSKAFPPTPMKNPATRYLLYQSLLPLQSMMVKEYAKSIEFDMSEELFLAQDSILASSNPQLHALLPLFISMTNTRSLVCCQICRQIIWASTKYLHLVQHVVFICSGYAPGIALQETPCTTCKAITSQHTCVGLIHSPNDIIPDSVIAQTTLSREQFRDCQIATQGYFDVEMLLQSLPKDFPNYLQNIVNSSIYSWCHKEFQFLTDVIAKYFPSIAIPEVQDLTFDPSIQFSSPFHLNHPTRSQFPVKPGSKPGSIPSIIYAADITTTPPRLSQFHTNSPMFDWFDYNSAQIIPQTNHTASNQIVGQPQVTTVSTPNAQQAQDENPWYIVEIDPVTKATKYVCKQCKRVFGGLRYLVAHQTTKCDPTYEHKIRKPSQKRGVGPITAGDEIDLLPEEHPNETRLDKPIIDLTASNTPLLQQTSIKHNPSLPNSLTSESKLELSKSSSTVNINGSKPKFIPPATTSESNIIRNSNPRALIQKPQQIKPPIPSTDLLDFDHVESKGFNFNTKRHSNSSNNHSYNRNFTSSDPTSIPQNNKPPLSSFTYLRGDPLPTVVPQWQNFFVPSFDSKPTATLNEHMNDHQ